MEKEETLLQAGQRARWDVWPRHEGRPRYTSGVTVKRWQHHQRHVRIKELEAERELREAYGPRVSATKLVDEEIRPLAQLRAEQAHDVGSAERRSAAAAAERARWHHEIRWDRDDAWRRVHDEECVDCKDAPAEYFGLDAQTMREVRAAPRSKRARHAGVEERPPSAREVESAREAPSSSYHASARQQRGHGEDPAPPAEEGNRRLPLGNGAKPAEARLDGRRERREKAPKTRTAKRRPTILHLFAGRRRRRGTVGAAAEARGAGVEEIDILQGGDEHDILRAPVYARLLRRARAGRYRAVVAGVLCESFSLLKLRARRAKKAGAAPAMARSRERPEGQAGVTRKQRRYLARHNTVVTRSVRLAEAVVGAGGDYVIENPADRGDPSSKLFRWRWRRHVPLWLMPRIVALRRRTKGVEVTFPQCRMGGHFQKWTTLLASPRAAARLAPLTSLECTHERHARVAEGEAAKQAAEYPARLAETIAAAALDEEPPRLTQALGNARAAELLERSFTEQGELSEDDVMSESGDDAEGAGGWRAAVGSLPQAWPERGDMLSEATQEKLEQELAYTSRRRSEAASREELMRRPMPEPCPPVDVPAEEPDGYVWPSRAPPRPIAIAQLYADGTYADIKSWLRKANDVLLAW